MEEGREVSIRQKEMMETGETIQSKGRRLGGYPKKKTGKNFKVQGKHKKITVSLGRYYPKYSKKRDDRGESLD